MKCSLLVLIESNRWENLSFEINAISAYSGDIKIEIYTEVAKYF